MSMFRKQLAAAAAVAWLGLSPAMSPAAQTARSVPDFTVFLDPPTGFVFVKMPSGWKFVGRADIGQSTSTPAGVVTSLLEGSDDDPPEPQALAVKQP